MSKIVFVLGAGASAEAGAPLMGNFLDVAETKLVDQGFEALFDAIGELGSLHSKANLNLNNIEFVFATFEMARLLEKSLGPELASPADLIALLKKLIVRTLELTIEFPFSNSSGPRPTPAYDDFARFLRDLQAQLHGPWPASVLSFNYDIALDFAMYKCGLGPEYCLGHEPTSRGLKLLKLHGSINWAQCADGRIVPYSLAEYFASKRYISVGLQHFEKIHIEIGSELSTFKGCGSAETPQPYIVPPTWTKASQHQELAAVWRQAAVELSEAESIVVIGYSFPESDAFFRYLYALGTLSKRRLKKFWVIDTSGAAADRFKDMLGQGVSNRFQHLPFVFSGAIPALRQEFGLAAG